MYFPDGMKTGTFTAWLQVDALVESGSSGGPVVNNRGEVIGIIARGSTGSFGFCIPSDQVRKVKSELENLGEVKRGWLGLLFAPGLNYCQALGMEEPASGPVVSEIEAESPLFGQVMPGDLLVTFDGQPVVGRHEEDLPAVRAMIAERAPGASVRLGFMQPGVAGTFELVATFGEQVPASGKNAECKEWGMTVRGITRETVKDYALPNAQGVLVTGVREGGPAAVSGIQAGFVIRSVAGQEVRTLEDLVRLFDASGKSQPVMLSTTAGKFSLMHLIEPDTTEGEAR
jgi:serine protease Do